MGKNTINQKAHNDLRARMAENYQKGKEPEEIYHDAADFSGLTIEHLRRLHSLRTIRAHIRESFALKSKSLQNA